MKKVRFLLAVLAFSFTLLTGCQKDLKEENANSPTQADGIASLKSNAQLSEALKTKFEKLQSSLPASFKARVSQNAALFAGAHPEYRDAVLRALHAVEPTPCNPNTALNLWLDQQLANWNSEVIYYALNTLMLYIPQDYAFIYENSSSNQYFGSEGQNTHDITKTFKDLKRFWNIQSEDIVIVAMHGSTLRDRSKLIKMYLLYGLNTEDAALYADFVLELLKVFPQYRNGEHPIFTFNAFAVESFNFPPVGLIPDKIVMGDGVLEGYDAIGYGDVAPQAILAHEFGHHIQYQLNLFTDESSPEATRRTELMADAYAAYYLSHARGASMQWKRVKQFLQVFFNVGDCAFDDNNHHGTPTQRMAAAEWGYQVADNAQKQGHILTAQQFTGLFEAALPEIINH